MSWQSILKTEKEEWKALSEVLLGEFDYERWMDTPIPDGLKSLKNKFNVMRANSFDQALKMVSSKERKLIVCFGSLYNVGNILNKN